MRSRIRRERLTGDAANHCLEKPGPLSSGDIEVYGFGCAKASRPVAQVAAVIVVVLEFSTSPSMPSAVAPFKRDSRYPLLRGPASTRRAISFAHKPPQVHKRWLNDAAGALRGTKPNQGPS